MTYECDSKRDWAARMDGHGLIQRTLIRVCGLGFAVTVTGPPAAAQSNEPVEMVTAAELTRHVQALTAASIDMGLTPSQGLERSARYVAGELRALGLDSGPGHMAGRDSVSEWGLDRYRMPGHLRLRLAATSLEASSVLRTRGAAVIDDHGDWAFAPTLILSFANTVRFLSDTIPESGAHKGGSFSVVPSVVLLIGPHTSTSVRQAEIGDRLVLYAPPVTTDSTTQHAVIDLLRHSNNVLVLDPSDDDSTVFVARQRAAGAQPPVVVDRVWERSRQVRGWAAAVYPPAVREWLTAVGVDLAEARAARVPEIRSLPITAFGLQLAFDSVDSWSEDTAVTDRGVPLLMNTGVNVVATLPGRGAQLRGRQPIEATSRDECIVLRTHLGHADIVSDSTLPGSHRRDHNDNVMGVAGLMTLARAFSAVPPRRKLVILSTIGREGSVGSTHWLMARHGCRAMVDVNLDLTNVIDDSVVINGLTEVELSRHPAWLAAQYPELDVTVVEGGSVISDSHDDAFIRAWVPSLFIHTSVSQARDGRRGDATDVLEAERVARILKLVYYIVHDMANAERMPQWTSAARQRLAELGKP